MFAEVPEAKGVEVKPTGGITLFQIAGINITLDFSWFIVFALVLLALSAGYFPRNYPGYGSGSYLLVGLIATMLFFASVVIHELAHSLVALRSGIEIREITLFIFGGMARITEEPRTPQMELKIAAVGPLSSFGLAFGFWLIKSIIWGAEPSLLGAVFDYLAWINLALGVFNLIPGFPLDGGRVLRAIWWWKTDSLTRATKVASDIGKWFAVALMVLGGLEIFAGALLNGLWLIFIGMFLRAMSERGYEEVIIRKSLEGMRIEEVMTREVVTVPPDLPLANLVHDYFLRYAYRSFPVVHEQRVLGLVLVTAVKDIPRKEQESRKVAEVMIPPSDSLVISPDASLAEALKRMSQDEVEQLLVMDRDQMVGLITKTGLLRFIQIRQILEA
jgi:Zn-dependent protease/predicted transcriptional regulator